MHMILTKDGKAEIMFDPIARKPYRRELSQEELDHIAQEKLQREKVEIARSILNSKELSDEEKILAFFANGVELDQMIPLILECV